MVTIYFEGVENDAGDLEGMEMPLCEEHRRRQENADTHTVYIPLRQDRRPCVLCMLEGAIEETADSSESMQKRRVQEVLNAVMDGLEGDLECDVAPKNRTH